MRNFKMLFINSLLSTTVLLGCSFNSYAATWEINGLEAPRALGEAEAAFNKVRRAEGKIGDTPQNALDTISAIEEELFELNKKISDGASAYEIREKAMEEEIAHDQNLADINQQKAHEKRVALDARHDRITSTLKRIKDNDPTLKQLAQIRTEFLPELTQIENDITNLRAEETNVRNALKHRQIQRQLELDELKANIPHVSERMSISERLRQAQRIGLETEEEVSKLREQEHATATAFMRELLANTPEYLVAVKASFKDKVFYHGKWLPNGEAQATIQAEKDAIAKLLVKEEDNLAKLENSTKVWRGKVRELAQEIKQKSDTATQMLNLIAEEQERTLWINMGLEMGGTIASSLATGGIAVVVKLVKETDTFVQGLGKIRKSLADLPLENNKLLMESITADLSKTINGEAIEALTVADNIYDVGLRFDINRNTGARSDAALLIAGDLTEMVVSTIIEEGIGATKTYFTGVANAATPTVTIVKGVGVDLATTGLKALVTARAQSLNQDRAREYLKAHVGAEVYHATFLEAKHVWLRLDAVTKAQKEMVDALRLRAENGPLALKLDKQDDQGEASKGDVIEIELEFSNPMIAAPLISGYGLSFTDAKESDASKRRWKVSATLEQDDLSEVNLDIGLDKRERPYFSLDTDPSTPPRLASLIKDHWDGYEDGSDINHTLHFGLTPITFCGGVNYKTESEKLQSMLGDAYGPLSHQVETQIASFGSADGKKVLNENMDVEKFGISQEQFDETFELNYFMYVDVAAGGKMTNGSDIFPSTGKEFSITHYCSMIEKISEQCMSPQTKAKVQGTC